MILPPEEIKIKRKRTDDPVDVLRIHESRGKKLKFATDFVFYRQLCADSSNAALGPQTTHTNLASTCKSSTHVPTENLNHKLNGVVKTNNFKAPRHFHISRSVANLDSIHPIPSPNRKRKAETVFVERKPRPVPKSRLSYDTKTSAKSNSSTQISSHLDKVSRLVDINPAPDCEASSQVPLRSVCLPSGTVIPWDVSTQKLAAEMQAYTLSEISKNVAASDAECASNVSKSNIPMTLTSPSRQQQSARFKPKAPALRYKDREQDKQDINSEMDFDIEYVERDEGEGEDWVVETFLRRPLEDTPAESFVNFGFLVLDTEAEIDEFYQDNSDTEEEDGEDDENAENHYSADYPEDEVASDDEFDCNAYHYTNDLDEFDADSFSADEDEKQRYPWMQKPWIGRQIELDLDNAENNEYD